MSLSANCLLVSYLYINESAIFISMVGKAGYDELKYKRRRTPILVKFNEQLTVHYTCFIIVVLQFSIFHQAWLKYLLSYTLNVM